MTCPPLRLKLSALAPKRRGLGAELGLYYWDGALVYGLLDLDSKIDRHRYPADLVIIVIITH